MTDLFSDYYLFARPSFFAEMGRVLDLGATLNEYNTSPTEEIADTRAIGSDWAAVGQDLRGAMANHGARQKEQTS